MGDRLLTEWLANAFQTDAPKLHIVVSDPAQGYAITTPENISENAVMFVYNGGAFERAVLPHDVMEEIGLSPEESATYLDSGMFIDKASQYFNDVRQNAYRLLDHISDETGLTVQHDLTGVDIDALDEVSGINNITSVTEALVGDLENILSQQGNENLYYELPDIMPEVQKTLAEVRIAGELAEQGEALQANRTNLLEHSIDRAPKIQTPDYPLTPNDA